MQNVIRLGSGRHLQKIFESSSGFIWCFNALEAGLLMFQCSGGWSTSSRRTWEHAKSYGSMMEFQSSGNQTTPRTATPPRPLAIRASPHSKSIPCVLGLNSNVRVTRITGHCFFRGVAPFSILLVSALQCKVLKI